VERDGGTLPRELLNQVIVLSQGHLKRLRKEYIEGYYHQACPHPGLDGDTPFPTNKPEPVTEPSRLVSIPAVGGLHHRYVRLAAYLLPSGTIPESQGRQSPFGEGQLTP
jgi:hypothetical protein